MVKWVIAAMLANLVLTMQCPVTSTTLGGFSGNVSSWTKLPTKSAETLKEHRTCD